MMDTQSSQSQTKSIEISEEMRATLLRASQVMQEYRKNISYFFKKKKQLIKESDAMLICTGAGMGVGSKLGTFRGPNAGVWPPLQKLGIDFTEM